MRYKNVLVSGCGGDLGISIGKILKNSKLFSQVIGCDIYEEHVGCFVFDKCEVIDSVDSKNYLNKISQVVEKYSIDIIFTASDPELIFFYKNRFTHIKKSPIFLLNEDVLETCLDKYLTYEFLKSIYVPYPWTLKVEDGLPLKFPCILKDRFGHGSKNVIVVNESNFKLYKNNFKGMIWQEYLFPDQEEYTCNIYHSKSGDEVRTIIFKRKLAKGMSMYGEVVRNDEIDSVLFKIAKNLNIIGKSINVQLRLTKKGPVVFEINPRFSGTVLFRHMLGYEDLIWALREANGELLDKYEAVQEGCRFYRGYCEHVVTG